jgi:hypothetical protein
LQRDRVERARYPVIVRVGCLRALATSTARDSPRLEFRGRDARVDGHPNGRLLRLRALDRRRVPFPFRLVLVHRSIGCGEQHLPGGSILREYGHADAD